MSRYLHTGILRTVLGIFFLVLGITNGIPGMDGSVFSIDSHEKWLNGAAGIVEALLGIFLLLEFSGLMNRTFRSWANFAALLFWLVRMVFVRFFLTLTVSSNALLFSPSFSGWLLLLSIELIIAASLFVVYRTYD